MVLLSCRITLGKPRLGKMALTLILLAAIVMPMSVAAETPILRLHGTDLAPSTIYIGDVHAEEIHDIVMLQIAINTTHSEGVTLNSMTVHKTGTAPDTDVESLSLYEDIDHDGELDFDTDLRLSTANFDLELAELSVLLNITPASPLTLLIALNISSEATSGGTIGVDIPNEDDITTKESASIEFSFSLCSKNSTIWLDTDGDLNPDNTDPDDDNDGYSDTRETDEGTDPLDNTSVPVDTDKDYVPDSIDTDDDGDGVPDKYDDFPLDASRQRDYTLVYIYATIAAFLIIVMIFLRMKSRRKTKGLTEKELSEDEEIEREIEADEEEEPEEEIEEELEIDEEEEPEEEIEEGLEIDEEEEPEEEIEEGLGDDQEEGTKD